MATNSPACVSPVSLLLYTEGLALPPVSRPHSLECIYSPFPHILFFCAPWLQWTFYCPLPWALIFLPFSRSSLPPRCSVCILITSSTFISFFLLLLLSPSACVSLSLLLWREAEGENEPVSLRLSFSLMTPCDFDGLSLQTVSPSYSHCAQTCCHIH